MIDRQAVWNGLFKLKNAGINVDKQIEIMANCSDIPRSIIEFLRDNSPQFQFYRYIQKYQKALAENILDYEKLDNHSKLITCSSLITRILIAVKYKNLDETLVEDLDVKKISEAINLAISKYDYSKVNEVLKSHNESLRLFYLHNKEE